MAKTKVIQALRTQKAKNFLEDLSVAGNTYMFTSKPTAWPNDNSPPAVTGSASEYHAIYNEMLAVASVPAADIRFMIRTNKWEASSVYDMYRHDYSADNRAYSGAAFLEEASYVVINSANDVYICLNNNGDTASLVEPSGTSQVPFTTSDGYQWLYIYGLTATEVTDYTSGLFTPVSNTVSSPLTEGAVYSVVLNSGGADYTTNPSGGLNQIPYYFVSIRGDGTGGVARIRVVSGSVTSVDIVRNGSGYTYATIPFSSGNCFDSIDDLDANQNPLDPEGNGLFDATVIIQPNGGFRSDIMNDISCKSVGIFGNLNHDSFNNIDFTQFRQVGILHQPSFLGGETPASTNTTYAVTGNMVGGTGTFQIGEIIEQTLSNGKIARGMVVGIKNDVVVDSVEGTTATVIRYIQVPQLHEDIDGNLYRFSGLTNILGDTSEASMVIQPANGVFDTATFIGGYAEPNITFGTGEVIYLSNLLPVTRVALQDEKVSCVINF